MEVKTVKIQRQQPTCEKVGAGLPEPHWLFIEFARASTWPGQKAVPHGFDSLLAVWIQKEDDRIPLCVVQSVHGFRSHVEESMTVLRKKEATLISEIFLKKTCQFSVKHTCSMICLMVFSLTTPDDFSLPASFGSVSEKTWIQIFENTFSAFTKC